ncbi:MAG: hypothetical protein IH863_01885 [Chloroflexi bacterium]|nr:hypothetical protein [Chloroflexota bacterium]
MLSAINLIGAAGLLAVLVFFAMDVVQLGSTVPVERQPSFRAGALIAELRHFTSFLVLLLMGIGGWKTADTLHARDPKSSNQPAVLMKRSQRRFGALAMCQNGHGSRGGGGVGGG